MSYKKGLTCGCCGTFFKTWDGYIDQDQDKGYGICKECQELAHDREVDQVNTAFQSVYNSVNEKNKKRLDKITNFLDRKAFVIRCIDKGILKWKIGK